MGERRGRRKGGRLLSNFVYSSDRKSKERLVISMKTNPYTLGQSSTSYPGSYIIITRYHTLFFFSFLHYLIPGTSTIERGRSSRQQYTRHKRCHTRKFLKCSSRSSRSRSSRTIAHFFFVVLEQAFNLLIGRALAFLRLLLPPPSPTRCS